MARDTLPPCRNPRPLQAVCTQLRQAVGDDGPPDRRHPSYAGTESDDAHSPARFRLGGSDPMDFRATRGREISRMRGIVRKGDVWLVPSQSRTGKRYRVIVTDQKKTCTCPDVTSNGGIPLMWSFRIYWHPSVLSHRPHVSQTARTFHLQNYIPTKANFEV